MKNNMLLCAQIDYVYEGIRLLDFLTAARHEEYQKLRETFDKKYPVDKNYFKQYISLLDRIHAQAETVFGERIPVIEEYFEELAPQVCMADLVRCEPESVSVNDPSPRDTSLCRRRYDRLTEAQKDADFIKCLSEISDLPKEELDAITGCEKRGVFVPDDKRVRNVITYIQSLDLSAEKRMRIQEIYLNREKYHEELLGMMDEAAALLAGYESEIGELLGVWKERWEQVLEQGVFYQKLKTILKIDDLEQNKKGVLLPSIVYGRVLHAQFQDGVVTGFEDKVNTFHIGLLITGDSEWNMPAQKTYDLEELLPVWKILGDKSKAEILLFIKDKPAYGSEIARHFSLTNATVSHHMNRLFEYRLVQVELQDGKLYYQARKEYLQELFERAGKLFS